MDDLDALLADLESTTSHISKRPVFLGEESYSYPTGHAPPPEIAITPPPSAEALNGTVQDPPELQNSALQSWPQDSSSPPLTQSEEEHVYSLPVKQRTDPVGGGWEMGDNLSELDRLLQELSAVQPSQPSFATEEQAPPPVPSSSTTDFIQANGVSAIGGSPAPKDMANQGIEDMRPGMESSAPIELRDVPGETAGPQQARMSASSATRELDELMASLSDFKIMSQGKGASPQAASSGNKLDSMLGNLQSDLNRLGVQTLAKGVCGACHKPIVGQVVTAMGKTWHPEHFVCTHCQEEIGSRNFFEREGQPYCETDYHNLYSPRCHYCNGPILDKVVTALDKTWHPDHFFCAQCGSFFGPEGFHEKDGKAYCRKDYFDMFAPKCGGCARAILENYISALNSLWHPECFVCRECFTPFINGSFFDHENQPYCEAHYHERRGSLCSGCQKPISGRCITAMGKKFHPEHFVCAFCLKQLNKGTFKEQNDKPYCQSCFLKLFS
ncbi:hypothetical protein GJAV_G00040070 [Gymnothorax javanicus]|nr:hypothetical protein GJAV_G00040070 [Gymnothorax javanicus]